MKNKGLARREFLELSAAAATAIASPFHSNASAQTRNPADRPNIIFIMADDLGYADLGCYGQREIHTPNIDRLAAQGMRFTQCYAGAPVCAPSRSVLMTGLHGGHTTVRDNHGINAPKHDGEEGRIPLKEDDLTVAELLKQAGYATGITGKWGLGEPGSTGVPNDQGFDEWFGFLNQSHADDYFTDHLWRNKELRTIEANRNGQRGSYTADLFSDFSLDFIRKNQDKPFFLYVPTTIPHKKLEVPDLGIYSDKPWPEEAKVYAAMVTRMDRHVGQIMDLLTELDLDEKTIVFFTSDNGSAKGWEGMFDSCGPLRGKKFSLNEGGIRCPMVARWPGRIPASTESNAIWHFADFLPTAAELAKAPVPSRTDGINVATALFEETGSLPERFLYWEKRRDEPTRLEQAVRWGDWKGIRFGLDKSLELYNLKDDIGEENDVSSKHPDIVSRIESYLKTARTPSPYWPVPSESLPR